MQQIRSSLGLELCVRCTRLGRRLQHAQELRQLRVAPVHVADDKEDRFAHVSYGEDSAGQSNSLIIHESLLEIESSSIGFESASERIHAEFAQACKLLSTNSDELGFRGS